MLAAKLPITVVHSLDFRSSSLIKIPGRSATRVGNVTVPTRLPAVESDLFVVELD